MVLAPAHFRLSTSALKSLRGSLPNLFIPVLCLLLVSLSAYGKEISSSSQLSAYKFQSYITSNEVVGGNISEQGGFVTTAEVIDPIIAGIKVPGFLSTDAKMTPEGPATWVNVKLRTGDPQFIDFAFIEIVSEVSYELAAFGSTAEAEIRIDARGKKNGLGSLVGSLSRAQITNQTDIKIYETDALGNRAAIAHSWLPQNPNAPTPGITTENFSDIEVPFVESNDKFTITTNQVYEVLVTSAAIVQFSDISSFNLSSFGYIESAFSSATPGIELAVSSFDTSDVTQISPPPKLTSNIDAENSDATISGGTRLTGTAEYSEIFKVGDSVEILATLEPESEDIGDAANVYLVVSTDSGLFQANSGGLTDFDGSEADLAPLSEITLRAVSEVNLTELMGGQINFKETDVGLYEVFIGYATEGSAISFTDEPIVIEVTN